MLAWVGATKGLARGFPRLVRSIIMVRRQLGLVAGASGGESSAALSACCLPSFENRAAVDARHHCRSVRQISRRVFPAKLESTTEGVPGWPSTVFTIPRRLLHAPSVGDKFGAPCTWLNWSIALQPYPHC